MSTTTHGPPSGKIILTYEDYLALPDDRNRYEIIEGELYVSPAPAPRHQEVLSELFAILKTHVDENNLGKVLFSPIDVLLGPTNVVQPDLLFIAKERLDIITERNIQGPPDLIVEVLSPSTEQTDRSDKLQLYARSKVPHYWIVDPTRHSIEAYALGEDAYTLEASASGTAAFKPSLFPEFALDLGRIWK
jgi:Uma2 family endonuclease